MIEQAIKELENYLQDLKFSTTIKKAQVPSIESFKICIESLNKQIGKMPKIEINEYPRGYTEVRDDDYRLVCPACGRELDEFEDVHHCKCGQKIDWERFNEL